MLGCTAQLIGARPGAYCQDEMPVYTLVSGGGGQGQSARAGDWGASSVKGRCEGQESCRKARGGSRLVHTRCIAVRSYQ